MATRKVVKTPQASQARQGKKGEAAEATQHEAPQFESPETFYARVSKRPDVREILKRLAR
jgi:hypothetical protein